MEIPAELHRKEAVMVSFTRILAPVDFSARSQGAAQYAEALACHFRSELILLNVALPVQTYGFPDAMAVAPELIEDVLTQSKATLNDFAQGLKGITVKRVVIEGDPGLEIVEYAKDTKCDLIVMPTHGYGPFRRFLLGSVTAKVLHDAHCPVWTGPHLEDAPAYTSISFGKVLCAIDLGPDSRAILEWGAEFAKEYGAALGVVHAIPTSAVNLGGMYFDPEWSSQVQKESQGVIKFILEEIGATAEILIRTGDAPHAVRSAAAEFGANVVVIGRGRSEQIFGRLRTNAYAILRESPCPVAAI
jgi:nucleotide-binding universal stress UspA family protein